MEKSIRRTEFKIPNYTVQKTAQGLLEVASVGQIYPTSGAANHINLLWMCGK